MSFNQPFPRGRLDVHILLLQVSPAEVEDVLMSHPAALDAAVVGKPHPSDTQHVTAYVVKVPGTDVTEDELTDFVNSKTFFIKFYNFQFYNVFAIS